MKAAFAAAAAAVAGCVAAPPVATEAPPPPQAALQAGPADPAGEDGDAARRARFAQWLAGFRTTARAAGIDDATLRRALDDVPLLPRVVELDRAQPEFNRAVWDYLDVAVSPQRVAQGRERLAGLRGGAAEAAAARYGVPLEVVVAIWGIESNYGSYVGDVPTIAALATLGFDGRREAWARGELIAALKLIQRGDVDADHLIGSWAGAIGQTQFLPSNVLAYAVDADGDGRRDLWGSLPDVIASTAHLLARSGWHTGEPWGAEVLLPAGFDWSRADDALRQPATGWSAEGVRSAVDGAPLPALADAVLLLPAGARGPAFLVGANFRALLRYNNAGSYALAVGLLAQRLAGGAGVQAAWPRDLQALSRSQSLALQQALMRRGFASGTADGLIGPLTRDALRRWQRSAGLPADGYPTVELLRRLQQEP